MLSLPYEEDIKMWTGLVLRKMRANGNIPVGVGRSVKLRLHNIIFSPV
jgi:hypothetical protein